MTWEPFRHLNWNFFVVSFYERKVPFDNGHCRMSKMVVTIACFPIQLECPRCVEWFAAVLTIGDGKWWWNRIFIGGWRSRDMGLASCDCFNELWHLMAGCDVSATKITGVAVSSQHVPVMSNFWLTCEPIPSRVVRRPSSSASVR